MGNLNGNAITVLIVDDEIAVWMALRAELEDAAMTVIEARNATEAILELEANMSIEAVLSDIRMPGTYGDFAVPFRILLDPKPILTQIANGMGPVVNFWGAHSAK